MESTVALRWAYSNKRQSSYQTPVPLADIDQSHPFEGADFGQHNPNMSDNAALFGKGHEFATREYLLSWDSRFRRQMFLTTKAAGWALAFHCGKCTTSALDIGPPAAYSHVIEYQDHYGTGYYGSARQLPVTTVVEQDTSTLVREFPSMLVSAVEITGNGNDFCRIACDLVGSGAMNRLDAANASAASATSIIGTGANGKVTVTVTATGADGNLWTIKVQKGVGNSAPLAAALVGNAITVTLATGLTGDLDNAANTATLVAAAVGALADSTAVASGTGADPITSLGTFFFSGGTDATTQAMTWPTGAAADEGERLRNTALVFIHGVTGDESDISCDVRSWRFRSEYALAEDDGYCPGSGYFVPGDPDSGQVRNKLEFLRRAVLVEWVIKASRDTSLFTRLEGLVEMTANITLIGAMVNDVDFHQIEINIPRTIYKAIPIGADGDVVTFSVSTVIFWDDTLANPYEITVQNDIPAYLASA